MNLPAHEEFYAVLNREGEPLARGKYVLAFSRREFADRAAANARLAGARIARFSDQADLLSFLEAVLRLGAEAIMVDDGQPNSSSIKLHPQTWDWAKFRRARQAGAGLETA